jgi:cell division protein FtsL
MTGEDVSTDSNVSMGVVKKCPSCGGVLKAFASSCELCGHELADVGANRTVLNLSQKFADLELEVSRAGLKGGALEKEIVMRKARLIRDFPIPNAREDLQSLVHFIYPKIQENIKPDPNVEDWRVKFKEVLTLAKQAYRDDAKTRSSFEEIERNLNVTLSNSLQTRVRRNPVVFVALAVVIVLAAVGLAVSHYQASQLASCQEKYVREAADETTRMNTLLASVEAHLAEKKYAEAQSALSGMVWNAFEGCSAEDANSAKAEWEARRQVLQARVAGAQADETAQKQALQAEADRAVQARQQDEEHRVSAEKQAAAAHAEAARQQKIDEDMDGALGARARAAAQRR